MLPKPRPVRRALSWRLPLALALLTALAPSPSLADDAPAGPGSASAPSEGSPARTEPGSAVAARRERRRARSREVVDTLEKTFTAYGFVKPTVAVSSVAGESFGRPNLSAVTAAGNPVLASNPDQHVFTFQVAQSRLGLRVREGRAVRGQLELDFIDFDKASPTVASLPRLRIAIAEWDPAPNHTIVLGQTWDLVAPAMPFGFNYVGANFQAGNLGFMRQQLMWRYRPSNFEVGLALGLPSPNVGPTTGPVEQGPLPTFSAAFGYSPSAAFTVRASGLVTQLAPTPDTRSLAWVAALGLEAKTPFGLEIRAEGYASQDGASLGLLVLSQGRAGVDVRDAGGWISIQQTIGKHAKPYVTFGGAAVLDPDDVVPDYTPATETTPAVRNGSAGPGILSNLGGRAGIEVPVLGGFALVAEGFGYDTVHRLAPQDSAVDGHRQVWGFEGGAIYRF